ncbi:MAG: sugar transferase [Flavobacterium sp.]|uniref:sugar transferase n=1 Tax=Flavobacterium sp. TaxID=239 RepID=UPI0012077E5C|nr:sugar transferase [Flavobacterium sp.]RZJ66062.1 MAG: sugar transferase [Flavobacterium sp.]
MLLKRILDFVVSLSVLLLFGWLIVLFWAIAAIDTKSSGIFRQTRIGQFAKPFTILKLRSMTDTDPKIITPYGKWMRKYKVDELPQFLHVLIGQMSLVGPRPDVPGYYDKLEGDDRNVLKLKPGLTSDAAIKYSNEDELLSEQPDPLRYNDEILFPDKVKMNLYYVENRSFFGDIATLLRTFAKFIPAKNRQ